MEINWEVLHSSAKEVMEKAYAPYSNFKVGVAGLVSDGRIVVGLFFIVAALFNFFLH